MQYRIHKHRVRLNVGFRFMSKLVFNETSSKTVVLTRHSMFNTFLATKFYVSEVYHCFDVHTYLRNMLMFIVHPSEVLVRNSTFYHE